MTKIEKSKVFIVVPAFNVGACLSDGSILNLPSFDERSLMASKFFIEMYVEIARRLSGVIHILSWLLLGQYFISIYDISNGTKMSVRLNGYLTLSVAIASALFFIGYLRLTGITNLSFSTPAKLLELMSLAVLWIILAKQAKGNLDSKYMQLFLLPIFLLLSVSLVRLYRSFQGGTQVILNEQIRTIQISDLLNQPGISAYESEVLYYHAIAIELKSTYIVDAANR